MPGYSPCSKIKLSVVVITFNEEKNIARCLYSVMPVADEIIVVDSFSTDRTKIICREFGVKYLEHPFEGFGMQKNFAVQQAHYHHILSLDADEELGKSLTEAISSLKKCWTKDFYAFNRITGFCGYWVRHGAWYPDKVIRLFDRRKARWSGELHEDILPDSPKSVGFLRGYLLHYSYYSVSHYLQKTELYTDIAAEMLYRKNRHPNMFHFYIKPFYRFFHAFFIRKGFLDGYIGYCIARLDAERLFIKYVKLKMLYRKNENFGINHCAPVKERKKDFQKMNMDPHD